MKKKNRNNRLLALGLAAVFATSAPVLCGGQSRAYAGSTDDSMISQAEDNAATRMESVRKSGSEFRAPTSTSGLKKSTTSGEGLPSKYDLRDRGLVTPVKSQEPWGTCWSFGNTAAAEASVLSDLGQTYESTGIDLSELHLAWFTFDPLKRGTDGTTSQKGEGLYYSGNTGSSWYKLDCGGDPFMGSLVYAQGTGPVNESTAPYKNTTGNVEGEEGNSWYSMYDEWNVPERLRFRQCTAITDCSILPDIVKKNYLGTATGTYSTGAINAMKREIYKGKPISACCYFEAETPDSSESKYMNLDNYSLYTYDSKSSNHVVTIVGWDDNYSRDNFKGTNKPPKDGAWIVKNSWGSTSSAYPDKYDWGVDGTGYFYMSYYDKGVSGCCSLDFDTSSLKEKSTTGHVNQYDYLPDMNIFDYRYSHPASAANVFKTKKNEKVTSVSALTSCNGTRVSIKVYRLRKNYKSPTDGTLVTSLRKNVTYIGYHRFYLPKTVKVRKGRAFSVVVQEKSSGRYFIPYVQGYSKAEMKNSGGVIDFYSKAVVNRGESYYRKKTSSGYRWYDWKNHTDRLRRNMKKYNLGSEIDNLNIKAYYDTY